MSDAEATSNAQYQRDLDAERLATRKRLQEQDDARVTYERTPQGMERVRQQAEDKAREAAEARYQEMMREHNDNVSRLSGRQDEPFVLGRSGETYPTEFDIAYSQAGSNTPPIQRNLLGSRSSGGATSTATASVLDDIAREARGLGRLKGYKDGNPFDPSGAIRDDLMSLIEGKVGKEISGTLRNYSQSRASGSFAPRLQGVRALRTEIGKKLRDIRKARAYDPTAKTEDEVFLQRLYGAVSDDFQTFLRDSPTGGLAANQYAQIDDAYRVYIEELKRPLRVIFGDKVTPEQAIERLVKSTQEAGGDINLLTAYLRVASHKGSRVTAVNAILSQMAKNGVTEFTDAIGRLSPSARRILFQRETAALGQQINRISAVAQRMRRFDRTGQTKQQAIERLAKQGVFAGVLGMINLPSVLTASLGAEVGSRILASRAFQNWLTRLPAVQAKSQSARTKHAIRFYNILLEQGGVNEAVASSALADALEIMEASPNG